uniref:PX domain-containing protein n=1 Tax=Xenopus tropicalis TaxID=8364 RepID=A0A803J5S4_XENTR
MDTEQASKSLDDVHQISSDSSAFLPEAGHSSDKYSATEEEWQAQQCKGSSDSNHIQCQHYLMTTRELQMYWKKEKHSSKPDTLLFEIQSARIAEDFLSKFVVYQIVIIRTGSFDENNVFIERRYSDFEKLHRTLLKEFKEEMEDVVFPKKVLIGNFTTDMISKRMLCLKNYLDELYAIKYIRWSKIYIDFFLDPELDEGYSCLRGGQYKKATEIFQQIVCLQEKLIQHCSILIVPPLCALVVCHKDLEDLQKAYEAVQEPTRNDSILDLVISNNNELISNICVGEHLGNSDYNMVSFEIMLQRQLYKGVTKTLNFRRADFASIRASLQCVNWERLFIGLDTEGKWNIFKTLLCRYTQQYIPHVSKERHRKAKPLWLNKSVSVEVGKKKRAFKAFRLAGTAETFIRYKEANKACKKAIRQAKIEMERGIAARSKNNPKLFFNYVNSKKMKKEGVGTLLSRGE